MGAHVEAEGVIETVKKDEESHRQRIAEEVSRAEAAIKEMQSHGEATQKAENEASVWKSQHNILAAELSREKRDRDSFKRKNLKLAEEINELKKKIENVHQRSLEETNELQRAHSASQMKLHEEIDAEKAKCNGLKKAFEENQQAVEVLKKQYDSLKLSNITLIEKATAASADAQSVKAQLEEQKETWLAQERAIKANSAVEVAKAKENAVQEAEKARAEERKAAANAAKLAAATWSATELRLVAEKEEANEAWRKRLEEAGQRFKDDLAQHIKRSDETRRYAIEAALREASAEFASTLREEKDSSKKSIRQLEIAHEKRLQEMKSEFDKDKQEAVSRALQMTLAELRSTLEQAHSEREKAVQIVREEWQNRLDEALKASKANAAKSMMALKTEQEVAVSAIRAKYEEEISELRSCVSEKVDRVAELVEQLETEREERRQFEKQISEAR